MFFCAETGYAADAIPARRRSVSMNLFRLFAVVLAERTARTGVARSPEPEVMVEPDQVHAYSETTLSDPIMAASYAYQAALATRVLHGCRTVVDLGCGPATQLSEVARLNPSIEFKGIDLSEAMLELGRERTASLGNVALQKGDITRLHEVADRSADGVISTVALHQLQTIEAMRACLAEAKRVLKPNGAMFIVDFGRLKRLESMLTFAYRLGWDTRGVNPARLSHYKRFKDDYFNSLWAAFEVRELEKACRELLPETVAFYTTAPIPLLCFMKTPDRQLSPDMERRLREFSNKLPRPVRRELKGIRRFCAFGGIVDPFRA